MKPRIDRTNLNPLTVKAGLPVSLDVKVFGEPPAKVTWYFKGEELQNRENLEIINVDYNTKFLMTKSKRAQSGKYVIKAKNEVGEDEAEIEITILGEYGSFLLCISQKKENHFILRQFALSHLDDDGNDTRLESI